MVKDKDNVLIIKKKKRMMNIGVHVSLSILVSSVCMPNSGIAVIEIELVIRQFYFQFFKESPHCSP